METIKAIKPGPKPKKEDGTPDKRPRLTPPNQPKHPDLKPISISLEIQNDETKVNYGESQLCLLGF